MMDMRDEGGRTGIFGKEGSLDNNFWKKIENPWEVFCSFANDTSADKSLMRRYWLSRSLTVCWILMLSILVNVR